MPFAVTTLRDSYACYYRELATLLTLSVGLAERGLEPLAIGSIRKNLTSVGRAFRQESKVPRVDTGPGEVFL